MHKPLEILVQECSYGDMDSYQHGRQIGFEAAYRLPTKDYSPDSGPMDYHTHFEFGNHIIRCLKKKAEAIEGCVKSLLDYFRRLRNPRTEEERLHKRYLDLILKKE